MKYYFRILLLCVIVLMSLSSCGEDDKKANPSDYDSYLTGLYSSEDNYDGNILELIFDQDSLVNKKVQFYTKDNKKAKMEFVNIIPEEEKTVIENIHLINDGSSNIYTFEGIYISKSTENYKYTGEMQRGIEYNILSLKFESM